MFHFFALNCPIFRERVDEVNAEGASELVLRDRIAFRYLSGQQILSLELLKSICMRPDDVIAADSKMQLCTLLRSPANNSALLLYSEMQAWCPSVQ